MKKWTSYLGLLLLSSTLVAKQPDPQEIQLEDDPATEIITPSWAVDPIGPPYSTKEPSPEMMKNKKAAAVVIGTAATIAIGLLVSGHNTGKDARSS